MKPSRHFSQMLQWSVVAVVVAVVIATGILTNITLRSIEKNLPITLLTELEALDLLLENLAEVVSVAEATKRAPNPENYIQLRLKVKIVFDGVVKLRETYVFDNLIQASALHAVVAPAVSDIQLWLVEGVSGYGPETATTLDIAISRITEAFSKARTLNHDSQKSAQKILNKQRIRLEHFLLSVNLLFLLTLTITVIMIFLVARRQVFLRRELEAQTELRRAEKTLQETEELYSKLITAIPDIVVRTDVNGQILLLNDFTLQISGYQRAEVLGKNLLEFVAPEDHESAVEYRSLMFDRKVGPREYSLIMKDGRKIPFEINSDVLRRNDGAPYGIVTIGRDITDRKRAEEEKRSLQERLRRAEKMEALGQLAGGVAHDLNNVLGVLSGYSELLLGEIPEGSRSRGHAEKILQSTEKGAAIIQDLLTLARRGVTASEVINLNSVVSGFLKTPVFEKIQAYHPRVTFRTECQAELLNIKGSPLHLEKTLINLVSNAAEAISGKGEVTIRTENRYLDKPLRGYDEVKEGDYAVLTVSDTGMGIPAENREKIFEPFYTKKTMSRSGTGLGLAIVWGTVKDHNGYIDVQTEVGEGTAFTLYFPATREERIAQQQKVPIERYMGNGESVLVVDDIAEQRDVAARLLTRLGYHVHLVSSGEEAVEYLKGNTADILVLDMIMAPGIDGLETYQRVLEINPKQKAIIVSGFSETERVGEAQRLGAGAYVKKPYITEKIGVAIRDELLKVSKQ